MPFEQSITVGFPASFLFAGQDFLDSGKRQPDSASRRPDENGIRVLVPPFISAGERIIVDTNEITYVRRAD